MAKGSFDSRQAACRVWAVTSWVGRATEEAPAIAPIQPSNKATKPIQPKHGNYAENDQPDAHPDNVYVHRNWAGWASRNKYCCPQGFENVPYRKKCE
jgi:hypothetical protein